MFSLGKRNIYVFWCCWQVQPLISINRTDRGPSFDRSNQVQPYRRFDEPSLTLYPSSFPSVNWKSRERTIFPLSFLSANTLWNYRDIKFLLCISQNFVFQLNVNIISDWTLQFFAFELFNWNNIQHSNLLT